MSKPYKEAHVQNFEIKTMTLYVKLCVERV